MSSGRTLRLGEAGMGLGVLALSLFIAIEDLLIKPVGNASLIGPKLFPALIALGLIIVGVLLVREAYSGHVEHEAGLELDWIAVGLASAGLVAEFLLVEWIGWVPTAALLFAAVARAFGSRRLVVDLAIGVVLGGLTFLVFDVGLDLSLPTGIVGDVLAPADPE